MENIDNWRDKLNRLNARTSVFHRSALLLFWDLAAKSRGVIEAVQDISSDMDTFHEHTNKPFSFDEGEPIVKRFLGSLLELYTLSEMIQMLGMEPFYNEIMSAEIDRLFGSKHTAYTRIDPRDIATLARLVSLAPTNEPERRAAKDNNARRESSKRKTKTKRRNRDSGRGKDT